MVQKDLVKLGMVNTVIPNVLESVSLFKKEAEKTIENKNTKAVKEAARKLKKQINKIMEYADYGQLFVFHKFIYDDLEQYLLFLDWVQTLPKSANNKHVSIIFLKVKGLLKVTFPLEKSIKDQEEEIIWEVKKNDSWSNKSEVKTSYSALFESKEEMDNYKEIEKNPACYSKSLQDIVNEKYENIGGELIVKSRLNPGIKINERRDCIL